MFPYFSRFLIFHVSLFVTFPYLSRFLIFHVSLFFTFPYFSKHAYLQHIQVLTGFECECLLDFYLPGKVAQKVTSTRSVVPREIAQTTSLHPTTSHHKRTTCHARVFVGRGLARYDVLVPPFGLVRRSRVLLSTLVLKTNIIIFWVWQHLIFSVFPDNTFIFFQHFICFFHPWRNILALIFPWPTFYFCRNG